MNAKLKMILSMTIFGTLGIFVRNIPLSSEETALYRAVIAAVAILVYKLFKRQRLHFSDFKKELPLLFCSGIAIGFNWIFLFQAYRYTTVSIATLSYYFAPVLVMAACPVIFHEKLRKTQVFCFLMATLGLIFVINAGGGANTASHFTGVCYGLAAAALYASVIILNKFMKRIGGIDRTLIQFFAAIIVLTPYVLLTGGVHLSQAGSFGLANLLAVGIVHTGITYCIYFSSLRDLSGQDAAILSYLDPLTAIIVSTAFLGEPISPSQIIGGLFILGFTLFNEISPPKQKSPCRR